MFEEYNDISILNNTADTKQITFVHNETDENFEDTIMSELPLSVMPLWPATRRLPYNTLSYTFYPERSIDFCINVSAPDIKEIVPNKVLEFTFSNGVNVKTVKDEQDEFDLEKAIGIACLKYLLGGTAEYNKFIKNTIKQYNKKKIDEEQEALKEKQNQEKKRKKLQRSV